jgi:hypothetical protein
MQITKAVLESVGAKYRTTPKTFSDKFTRGQPEAGKVTLVAIVYTPWGEHFKEVYTESVLNEIRHTPMAYEFFTLTKKQIENLAALHALA